MFSFGLSRFSELTGTLAGHILLVGCPLHRRSWSSGRSAGARLLRRNTAQEAELLHHENPPVPLAVRPVRRGTVRSPRRSACRGREAHRLCRRGTSQRPRMRCGTSSPQCGQRRIRQGVQNFVPVRQQFPGGVGGDRAPGQVPGALAERGERVAFGPERSSARSTAATVGDSATYPVTPEEPSRSLPSPAPARPYPRRTARPRRGGETPQ